MSYDESYFSTASSAFPLTRPKLLDLAISTRIIIGLLHHYQNYLYHHQRLVWIPKATYVRCWGRLPVPSRIRINSESWVRKAILRLSKTAQRDVTWRKLKSSSIGRRTRISAGIGAKLLTSPTIRRPESPDWMGNPIDWVTRDPYGLYFLDTFATLAQMEAWIIKVSSIETILEWKLRRRFGKRRWEFIFSVECNRGLRRLSHSCKNSSGRTVVERWLTLSNVVSCCIEK